MKQVTLVEWAELLRHAEKLGFYWNYAHELLRAFQGYDRLMEVYCTEIDEFEPMDDPYIGRFEKENIDHGDLNQMGRDIVYDFMQMHKLTVMSVTGND